MLKGELKLKGMEYLRRMCFLLHLSNIFLADSFLILFNNLEKMGKEDLKYKF